MLDKNGMEIKTGMVVEIKDAFFKNDNGLYFVEHSAVEEIRRAVYVKCLRVNI